MASRGNSPSGATEAGSHATVARGYDTCGVSRATRAHKKDAPALTRPTPSRERRRRRLGARRAGLAPRRENDQRERERERRVSDADTSHYGPLNGTQTLNHAIPQEKHANNNPLSLRPGPSPGQHPKRLTSITQTDPNPVLCLAPTPHWCQDVGSLIPQREANVKWGGFKWWGIFFRKQAPRESRCPSAPWRSGSTGRSRTTWPSGSSARRHLRAGGRGRVAAARSRPVSARAGAESGR
jgi:hypothetical protein